jgi:hypothetical protein
MKRMADLHVLGSIVRDRDAAANRSTASAGGGT